MEKDAEAASVDPQSDITFSWRERGEAELLPQFEEEMVLAFWNVGHMTDTVRMRKAAKIKDLYPFPGSCAALTIS